MFHQSKHEGKSGDGYRQMLTPSLSQHNLSNSLLHYTRTTPTIPSIRPSFRKYSLADMKLTSPKTKNVSDNSYISTRIDSRSPGYSSRVVQYHTEQEKSSPVTHSKYDKLGVFPIVHIFKKDSPLVKCKSSNSSDQMNSLELSKFNSLDHNRLLLEKIIKSSPVNENISHKKDANTKSVLDALKEISRKRIHSNEEDFILKDDGKRMHVTYDVESTSRKRFRHNMSDGEDSVSLNSPSHKLFPINEVMASQSSTNGYFSELSKKEENQSPKVTQSRPVPEVKYMDVETQTSIPQVTTTTQVTPVTEIVQKEPENVVTEQKETKPKRVSPVKIFDETPLERMRRNRLNALMGTLNKVEDIDRKDNLSSESEKSDKPLVSILSGTKSGSKSPKHVTFDLPSESSVESLIELSTSNSLGSVISTTQSTPTGLSMMTKTSAAIVSPIVSASITKSPLMDMSNQASSGQISGNTDPPHLKDQPTFTFGMQNQAASIVPPPSVTTAADSSSKNKDTIVQRNDSQFQPMFTNVTDQLSTSTPSEKPSQAGGFKFNLTATSSPTFTPFSFKTSVATSNAATLSQTSSMPSSSKETVPVFGQTSTQSNLLNHSFPNNNSTFCITKNQFNSPIPNVSDSVSASTSNMSIPTGSLTTKSSLPSLFDTKNVNTSTSATTSTLFNFTSNNPVTSSTFSSSLPSTVSFNFNPASTFGVSTSSTNFPSLSSTTTSFGGRNNNPLLTTTSFGGQTNNPLSTTTSFGEQSNNPLSSTTASFGGHNNGLSSTTMSFGGQTTNPLSSATTNFGGQTNNPLSTTTSFGGQTNNPLASTTTSFGGRTSNPFVSSASSPFNKPGSAFASPSSSVPQFPGSKTVENPTFSFGSSNVSFNTNPSMLKNVNNSTNFGSNATAKPAFGDSTTPTFGIATTTAPLTNNNTNVFGNTSHNIFGSSGAFAATTTASSFAPSSAVQFGTSFSTNQNPPFGTDAKSSTLFGSHNNIFGANTNPTAFSSNTVSFSTAGGFSSNNPSFSQSATNTLSSTFGPISSPFDKTSTSSEVSQFGSSTSAFSSPPSAFGTSNFTTNVSSTPGCVFNFGANNDANVKSPPVFSFGGSESIKPSFNFTKDAAPAFGGNNKPSFGTSPPVFNPAPQFNVPSPGGAMFNIGAGGSSTTSRSRMQHKGKRRT